MPVMCGSTTHSVATAATAASAALPPARSASTAAKVASGCEVAAMPSQAITGERPGSWKSRGMSGWMCRARRGLELPLKSRFGRRHRRRRFRLDHQLAPPRPRRARHIQPDMPRDFQLPGRSPVIACDGMAATSHPLATLAAVDALRAGGSAADAAVAAVATLCVVEPHMTGIGGDCYCLVSQPGKPVWGYNGSGRAGAKASFEALRAQGLREIGDSIHAVTVPGALDAWEAILKTHGRFGLDRALAPAIKYAEGGFPVAPRVAWDWQRYVGKLKADAGAAKHYLFNGAAPKEGDVIRLLALAATLKTIAAKGARAFYEGAIADDMAATVAARGSFLTAESQ